MYEAILTVVALMAAAGCGWTYWRMQQMEQTIKEQESQVRAKAVLVGELADEMVMASQYLYEAMDQCLARLEEERQVEAAPVTPAPAPQVATAPVAPAIVAAPAVQQEIAPPVASAPTAPTATSAPQPIPMAQADSTRVEEAKTAEVAGMRKVQGEALVGQALAAATADEAEQDAEFNPHFRAIALAGEGLELVEIARRTGIGVEELRLLLRFQEEMSVAA